MAAVQPPQPLQADFQEFHWIRTERFRPGFGRALAGRVQSEEVRDRFDPGSAGPGHGDGTSALSRRWRRGT
jgi:hypothetical protein